MYAENLEKKQNFVLDNRKYRVHSVALDFGKVWIETTTGTLITVALGTFVEKA